jgi:hypothetical protein
MNRREIYDTIHELKTNVDLYPLFLSLDIPKTVNKNGVTLNLSAISESDVVEILSQLKNITVKPETIVEREIPLVCETVAKPKVKTEFRKMNLTPIQKFIINSVS